MYPIVLFGYINIVTTGKFGFTQSNYTSLMGGFSGFFFSSLRHDFITVNIQVKMIVQILVQNLNAPHLLFLRMKSAHYRTTVLHSG